MTKIVFIGDSITEAYRDGIKKEDSFAQKVGAAYGFTEIINSGLSSDNAQGMLLRTYKDVISHKPDICFVMPGFNDASLDRPIDAFKNHIKTMIDAAKFNKITVILLSPVWGRSTNHINKFPKYLETLKDIAKEENLPFVDLYSHFKDLSQKPDFPSLYLDWAHPSKAGHEEITNFIMDNDDVCHLIQPITGHNCEGI